MAAIYHANRQKKNLFSKAAIIIDRHYLTGGGCNYRLRLSMWGACPNWDQLEQ